MKNSLHTLGNSIAIIGRKRVGKNFFANRLKLILHNLGIEELKEVSISYYLKKNSYTPLFGNKNEFDFTYLAKDYFDFIKNIVNTKKTIEKKDFSMFSEGLSEKIYNNLINQTPDYGYGLMSDDEKLELIEYFKTLENYRTRLSLQIFGDYIKAKTNNNFILSTILIEQIKKDKYSPITGYINTDTRFISELIDFVIEGFYIIFLENNKLNAEKPWEEHVSEIELGISEIKPGNIINVEGKKGDILIDGIERPSVDYIDNKIQEIIPHLLSFRGYKKEDVNTIKKIKEFLLNGGYNFFTNQKRLMDEFTKYKNTKTDEQLEVLIESYNIYEKSRNLILTEINDIIKKYYN